MIDLLFGGADRLLLAFLFITIMEFLTWIASRRKEATMRQMILSHSKKKVGMWFLLITAVQLDLMLGHESLFYRHLTLLFLIGTEGLVLVDRLTVFGVSVPPFIKQVLQQSKEEDKTKSEEEKGGN